MFTDYILPVNSQLASEESKCLLSGGLKDTPVREENMMLFYYTKNCFYPLGPVVWTKQSVQISSHMDGGYFGWTNLTD